MIEKNEKTEADEGSQSSFFLSFWVESKKWLQGFDKKAMHDTFMIAIRQTKKSTKTSALTLFRSM